MITAALTLAAFLGAVQAGPTPTQIEAGCGYIPGSRTMIAVDVGAFYDSPTPAFVDDRYRAVRVGNGWQRSDRSPYSGAANRPWFQNGDTLSFDGRAYRKFGFPRILDREALTVAGEHDRVAILREAGTSSGEVVYVQTNGGQCEFQPYSAG